MNKRKILSYALALSLVGCSSDPKLPYPEIKKGAHVEVQEKSGYSFYGHVDYKNKDGINIKQISAGDAFIPWESIRFIKKM